MAVRDVLYDYLEVDELTLLQEALGRAVRRAGSIRSLGNISGIPYSTLQAIISGETSTPSARTQRALDQLFDSMPVQVIPQRSTVNVTATQWTTRKLANLQAPAGATHWLPVLRTEGTSSGMGARHYRPLDQSSPADLLLDPSFDPRQLRHIVFGYGQK